MVILALISGFMVSGNLSTDTLAVTVNSRRHQIEIVAGPCSVPAIVGPIDAMDGTGTGQLDRARSATRSASAHKRQTTCNALTGAGGRSLVMLRSKRSAVRICPGPYRKHENPAPSELVAGIFRLRKASPKRRTPTGGQKEPGSVDRGQTCDSP